MNDLKNDDKTLEEAQVALERLAESYGISSIEAYSRIVNQHVANWEIPGLPKKPKP